jgi:drug/metabolite transporter (DMT)-like permease
MKPNLKVGILLMFICTLFTSTGQYFFKSGSNLFAFTIQGILFNVPLLLGFFFYGFGAILLMVALKFGDLSKIYPFVSLNFIWVTLMSVFLLGEQLNSYKINAVILVIFGVLLIGGSS